MRLRMFLFGSATRAAHYTLLTPIKSDDGPSARKRPHSGSWRRRWLFCFAVVLFLATVIYCVGFTKVEVAALKILFHTIGGSPLPPTFEEYYAMERAYPQHNVSLPHPEGIDGRYVWFSNQEYGLGWNNIFQAVYMMSHMAYLSNRAFVFEPYTWQKGPEPFAPYYGKLIPAHIPLAALVDGPIAGGPFPPESPAPRAVSAEWFKEICPEERRTRISIKEMNERLNGKKLNGENPTTLEIMQEYVQVLSNSTDSCIEMFGGEMDHPFGWVEFGGSALTTIWPSLRVSPIITAFSWSALVLSAVQTAAVKIAPEFGQAPLPDVVDDLMAVHIRRGDYVRHCKRLSNWGSLYMGWNQMLGLADEFSPPVDEPPGTKLEYYLTHCWPSIEQTVARINEARSEWEAEAGSKSLRRVYVLTNGDRQWLEELKAKLWENDWDVVLTSRDLSLGFEEKYVAQAVDMAIAERAAVFIGNGFSSMTANIVLMRNAYALPPISNHFW